MTEAEIFEFRAFKARQDRAEMRGIIRKIKRHQLTKSEKLILEVMVNLWFAHRYEEGVIRPGRDYLAKRCDVSRDTVTVALARFRDLNIIEAVEYAKGGSKATRYTVNLDVIRDLFEPLKPVRLAGRLVPITGRNSGGSKSLNPAVTPKENPSRYITNLRVYTASASFPFQAGNHSDFASRDGGANA